MAKFDLKGMLSERSTQEMDLPEQKTVYRNPEDLIPSKDNFYSTEDTEKLKQSIKALGILQPLLIEERGGKDYILAGHSRRKCCLELIEEGLDRFRKIPCVYKPKIELSTASEEDEIIRKIIIIQSNTYREKSDWEKMTETLKMEGLVKELREKSPMEGKTRDILKDLIGTSGGQLGRYHSISINLCEQLMSEFKEDRIKISVAYEVSKLNKEYQKQACELYEEAGVLTLDDIRDLYRQQEAEKGIPGQMTIETATGQNRPPEDDTEIPAETQIERFYESTNKNMKNYIIQEDKNMTIFMLSNLYGSARVRNGHLNYQGSTAGITFNPGGVFEHELSWQSLAKILIGKYGHKKPVKMVPVDTPDNTEYTISAAVKAFCEAYPEKLKTIMRICRLYNNNGDAARAAQKRIAPYGYHGCTGPEVGYTFMGLNAGLEIEIGKEKVSMKYGRLIAEAKKLYDPWDSKFDEEERCQSVAETPDEKQQKHFVEGNKMSDHPGETTEMPDAWPQDLKDIPIPTEIEITGYLYDEERKLREILEVEKEEPGMPRMEIMRQQMITAGLRLIKNLVKDCREE